MLFMSCPTASVMRRQIASPLLVAGARELVGARGALLERLFTVALKHQSSDAPDVDLGYHATNTAGFAV